MRCQNCGQSFHVLGKNERTIVLIGVIVYALFLASGVRIQGISLAPFSIGVSIAVVLIRRRFSARYISSCQTVSLLKQFVLKMALVVGIAGTLSITCLRERELSEWLVTSIMIVSALLIGMPMLIIARMRRCGAQEHNC